MTALQIVLTALALVVAVCLVYLIAVDHEPNDWVYGALALLEIGLVAQLAVGLLRLRGEHGDVNVAAYVGYLVGSLMILPAAFLWSAGERTRAGTGVLLVAVIVVPVLFLRLNQLWSP
jgi:Kef-type K+ transport system membrane component KefB